MNTIECRDLLPAKVHRRGAGVEPLEQRIAPATFIVTSTADSEEGSLRQAILDANELPGLDTIAFAIPGAPENFYIIRPFTALPTITDPVVIDGLTQGNAQANTATAGNNAALRIAIHGDYLTSADGLTLAGTGGSTVRGISFDGFEDDGEGFGYAIRLESSNNVIAGNEFTFTPRGEEREITDDSTDAGAIRVDSGTGNVIGGLTPAAQNVIGSLGNGIELHGPSGGTQVLGNLIGTDKTGTLPIGAAGSGILISDSANNVIGGSIAGARNLISGSLSVGVRLSGPAAAENTIQGNFIGTSVTGSLSVGNAVGIQIEKGAHDNEIGGSDAGEGNVISGNGDGVVLIGFGTKYNVVAGNFIGTNASGSAALGNTGDGVKILGSAGDNIIGGTEAGARNIISGNGGSGISLASGSTSGGTTLPVGDLPGERRLPGFLTTSFAANDDGSIGAPIGFPVNFFGVVSDSLFVNNNGNVTFGSALSSYTPTALNSDNGGVPIIAAFFADVDTRGAASSLVTYGNDTIAGRNVFGVNYLNVGYYSAHTEKLNSFQLLLIDRSETGTGNFDIEFDYYQIQWETGDASGGSGGLGGTSARVGYSNGSGVAGTFFELNGSGINGAFLDSGSRPLKETSIGSLVPGRIRLEVREGQVQSSPSTNTIQGNYIGTDVTGTLELGNGAEGVLIAGGSKSNRVLGNLISGNTGNGVTLDGPGTDLNVVQGNKIGVDYTGSSALANARGVAVTGGAASNSIGGIGAGEGNQIAYNGHAPAPIGEIVSEPLAGAPTNPGTSGEGVLVGAGSIRNSILGNLIYGNLGDGIRLGTAVGSIDGNRGQAAPALVGAYRFDGETIFVGSLQSAPSAAYRIELFTDDGTGEGSIFLGTFDVTTDASGLASFAEQVDVATDLGQIITATATRKESATTFGDSSPFATTSEVSVSANIGDAAIVEGDSGDKVLTFTITLGELYPGGSTIFYNTAPYSNDARSATGDVDFTSVTGGSVQFSGTEFTRTVSINVRGDLQAEARERFVVFLNGAVHAVPVDREGVGTIIDDDQPAVFAGSATGSKVEVIDSITGTVLRSFDAFESSFRGGVRVASGDVTGDGLDDIITATGTGGGARVRVFDGADMSANPQPILTFQPYPRSYRGPVNVAAGDVNGDGRAEIIVGAAAGSLPELRVFDLEYNGTANPTPTLLSKFKAFPKVSGGVRVAAGDIDGDGLTEWIVTSGTSSEVRVFDGDGTPITKFQGFGKTVRTGAVATAGDLDADGRDELILGTAKGAAQIATFAFNGAAFAPVKTFSPLASIAGLRLAVADINRDGIAEIVAAQAAGSRSELQLLNSDTGSRLSTIPIFAGISAGGVFVA